MTRTAPLSRAASCLVLPTSAMWPRLVSSRLALKCKRLEAPSPGLLMLYHTPLPHFLNAIEASPGLLLLFDSSQPPFSGEKNGQRSLPLVLEQARVVFMPKTVAEEDAVASDSFMREAELAQTASCTFHAGCAPSMRSRQRVLFSQTRNRLRVTSNSPSRAVRVSGLSPGSSRWPKQSRR
jgi:hypothetical protein